MSPLLGNAKKVGFALLISQDLLIETMTFRQSQNWLSSARRRAKEGHPRFDYLELAYSTLLGFMQAMGGQSSSDDQEFDMKYR